jgi:hypothetical protein
VIIKKLEGGKPLERKEMYRVLEDAKISTSQTRGLHITGVLAQEGTICFGPRTGKQPCFVLLDEWIPNSRALKGDEALAELAQRYFPGHGPATIQDFSWWSGLTVTEAKKALEMVKEKFIAATLGDKTYWLSNSASFKIKTTGIYFLSSFDEYLVGYKDRSAALESLHARKVFAVNGIFNPVVIINGKIVATWKRSFNKKEVVIQLEPFQTFTPLQKEGIAKAAKRYSKFVGMNLQLRY